MEFIQIIEFKTSNIEAFSDLLRDWMAATEGVRTATRETMVADRDRPGWYRQIVEFPSFEAAMTNSDNPVTTEFAGRMQALCEEGPNFSNLDVVERSAL